MITLKINSMYKTKDGYIVPRSHLHQGTKGNSYFIAQILTGTDEHYTTKTTTISIKELREIMGITKNERITIK